MTTDPDPFTNVYHRIAERLSREFLSANIDAALVEAVLGDHAHSPLHPVIEDAIREEAREYGLEV